MRARRSSLLEADRSPPIGRQWRNTLIPPVVALLVSGACTIYPYPDPVATGRVPPPGYPPPGPSPPGSPPAGPPSAGPPSAGPSPAAPQSVPCVDPGARDVLNRFDRPMPVEPGSTTVACTFPNDEDLFVVTAPAGGFGHLVRYDVRAGNEMSPIVEVLDANRHRANRSAVEFTHEVRGWIHIASGTPAFIRVSSLHDVSDTYTLTLATSPIVDAAEPNDDAAHATPLRAGKPLTAFLGAPLNAPSTVPDWYRIDAGRGGPLTIDVDMVEGVASNLLLYDANRKLIRQQMGGRGERLQFQASAGTGANHFSVNSLHDLPGAGTGEPPPWLTLPYRVTLTR